ncbi:protein TadG [Pasteurella multocida subsp. multocida OH4807]|nr:protein TadG [Pasteurella multocida subsp. multocida OH4807]
MKKNDLIYHYYSVIKRFYRNQHGVYTVMTALLTFPLLVAIAFAVDGTGILLDKARLAQATEQAALMLVAENNKYRKNQEHGDVKNQTVSAEDIAKHGGSSLKAQQDKRNLEMIHGMVKVYLRSEEQSLPNGIKPSDQPVTIPTPFSYLCEQDISAKTEIQSPTKTVTCVVNGDIHRQFWLPLSEQLVKPQTVGHRLPISSGMSMAVKENGLTAPIDLMLVSDFSKSMLWEVGKPERDKKGNELPQGVYPNRKIDILRAVVKDISEVLLPKEEVEGISPYNRMGFTTFAAGARQRGNTEKCVLPYSLKKGIQSLEVKEIVLDREDEPQYFHSIYSNVIQNQHDCGGNYSYGHIISNDSCSIKTEPTNLLKVALDIGDWDTVNRIFNEFLDVQKTVEHINSFDGKEQKYDIEFKDERFCLGGNQGKATTQAWFDRKNSSSNSNIHSELNKIEPKGGTAATSGLIVGANIMMDKNKEQDAQPSQLKSNTQRILLVLSDGGDNQPSKTTLTRLFKGGLCNTIKNQIDSLQDKQFPTLPTRIAFVAFGYKPTQEQSDAWKACVGNHYYQVENREQLLKSFQQIISLDEEVGRATNAKKKSSLKKAK